MQLLSIVLFTEETQCVTALLVIHGAAYLEGSLPTCHIMQVPIPFGFGVICAQSTSWNRLKARNVEKLSYQLLLFLEYSDIAISRKFLVALYFSRQRLLGDGWC